jgi:glucuronate isomerase
MPFINKDFLLENERARALYHNFAAGEPVLDYHCHLSPKDIAEARRFQNLTEIWLEGDHYKWRAMRANGVAERYCTGDAAPYEKFLAWARTVPFTLRNPLYHWTHLELKRYFGLDELLDETTAPRIWKQANEQLVSEDLTAQGILRKFGVEILCTTDDPADSLRYHERLASSDCSTRVLPAFRPDRALAVEDPIAYRNWIEDLGAAANVEIHSLGGLLDALRKRHDYFHHLGCRLSDHGLDHCHSAPPTESQAAAIFTKALSGTVPSLSEREEFASFLMLFFGHLDAERGWTKQLHLGALRNVNTRMLATVGRDAGFDCIGDWPQAKPLVEYLDRLDRDNMLPKTIVYNLNPADNYVLAAVIGNFQDGKIAGKIQFGSGWWFLDQKQGIEWQLDALSNCGLLSRFIGMTTDSRSFMSFPRHEYFRRVLCNLLGREMENGQLPSDFELVGGMVRNVCFENARQYFGFQLPVRSTVQSRKVRLG